MLANIKWEPLWIYSAEIFTTKQIPLCFLFPTSPTFKSQYIASSSPFEQSILLYAAIVTV